MITRRAFLAGTGSALAVAACGSSSSSTTTGAAPPTTTTAAARSGPPAKEVIGAGFANGYDAPSVLIPGIAQRLPVVVFDEADGTPVRDGGPETIDVSVLQGTTIVATATLTKHALGIPTPYYPLTFTAPAAGEYEVRAAFSSSPLKFKVETTDTVKLLQVGQPLRPVVTPTLKNARGVDPICTRTPKACPFHTISLSDAIAAKKPIVFVISTPGFCQTAICGPVLEMLVDAAPTLSRFQIVHAEVYVEPNKKTSGAPKTTEAVSTYGLEYEPTLFVADAGSIVQARLDFSWDRTELDAALALVA